MSIHIKISLSYIRLKTKTRSISIKTSIPIIVKHRIKEEVVHLWSTVLINITKNRNNIHKVLKLMIIIQFTPIQISINIRNCSTKIIEGNYRNLLIKSLISNTLSHNI